MQLELADEETRALLNLLMETIENDRYLTHAIAGRQCQRHATLPAGQPSSVCAAKVGRA
jgi:hypothetical protein